ncbi:MAG: ATP-binding cassette domain-containing protein [Opitutales bacterium]
MKDEEEQVPKIKVENLSASYGEREVLKDVDFSVMSGEVMVVMGGSGCGKSTLLKAMIGLLEPVTGSVWYDQDNFTEADLTEREAVMRRFGVLYQGGALWTSMTLRENVSLPLEIYTNLRSREIRDLADFKLSLVGLKDFVDFLPAELSGGMRKRAGLARAMALDPEILFFDEPSAGLDPINSRRLDDLILELKESLGATFVVVSHELPSIFAIADDSIFLDAGAKGVLAKGPPKLLQEEGEDEVRRFLSRAKENETL